MRRTVVFPVGLLCAVTLGTGVLAGCTGSSGGGSAGGSVAGPAGETVRGAAAAPIAGASAAIPAAAGGAQKSSIDGAGSTVQTSARLNTGLRIRTAVIGVGITGAANVAVKAGAADAIALKAGGEVDTDDRTSGRHATATIQVRVPPAALQPVLDAFGHLGRERNRQVSSKDVTQQVADVTSRARSADAAIARLRRLYASAQKVSDVITIEDELSSREADLESLQAQQRALGNETATAAITLDLTTLPVHKHHAAVTKHKSRGGFLGGLSAGWHGFTAAATGVATAIGAALPFVLLLLLLALAIRLLWPRLTRLRPSSTKPAPSGDGVG
jgi:hypothetical protein